MYPCSILRKNTLGFVELEVVIIADDEVCSDTIKIQCTKNP